MNRIVNVTVHDIRFPTSLTSDGSDAMNPDGDYSAAYVVLETERPDLTGYGLTFTIGRGTDLCVAAARQIGARLVGENVDELDGYGIGRIYRAMQSDSQMRWLGPEKGVVQMSAGAVLNAVWDLTARRTGKPVWRLLCEMEPEELVSACDFRYLSDVLSPDEAIRMLNEKRPTQPIRRALIEESGYPGYTTTPGWLGYPDDKLERLCHEAVEAGWTHVKLKVGADLEDDVRRLGIARGVLGPDRGLMIDANQVWDVDQAIEWLARLAAFDPLWIEEPTSPDDILGHRRIRDAVAPMGVATGEHAHNRVMFKQLLQVEAIDYCQIDSCRVASINEIVPILLMAAKYGVPVCPHAGGVGLCEYVQHLSVFDYVAVSGDLTSRLIEYVDHLHEHFIDPVVIDRGYYRVPHAAGYSIEMHNDSVQRYRYPDGRYWEENRHQSPVDRDQSAG